MGNSLPGDPRVLVLLEIPDIQPWSLSIVLYVSAPVCPRQRPSLLSGSFRCHPVKRAPKSALSYSESLATLKGSNSFAAAADTELYTYRNYSLRLPGATWSSGYFQASEYFHFRPYSPLDLERKKPLPGPNVLQSPKPWSARSVD